jgi:hypothetical protein
MRLPPLSNAVMLLALLVLAGVQVALVIEFWSSFAGESPFFKAVFVGLGLGFAGVELVALVVCANAARAGAWVRANVFRLIFLALFAANLVSDVGAIYAFTTTDADARSAAQIAGDDARRDIADITERRAALRATLAERKLDMPVRALEIQRNAAIAARNAGGAGERTQSWRVQRAAALDAALETAREIETLDKRIATMRATAAASPHSGDHPQLQALATILSWCNLTVTTDTLRVALALAMAVVLRCVLAFGFWAAAPVDGGWAMTALAKDKKATAQPIGNPSLSTRVKYMLPKTPNAPASPAATYPVKPQGAVATPAAPKAKLRMVGSEPSKSAPAATVIIDRPAAPSSANGRSQPKAGAERPPQNTDLIEALNKLEDELTPSGNFAVPAVNPNLAPHSRQER